jgi:hypothetical protein
MMKWIKLCSMYRSHNMWQHFWNGTFGPGQEVTTCVKTSQLKPKCYKLNNWQLWEKKWSLRQRCLKFLYNLKAPSKHNGDL